MPKWLALSCALLAVSASAFAQPKVTAAPPEPSLWDHNGSLVSLVVQGSLREFRYKEPRAGMAEAGARPGSVLFRGKAENGQYIGMAFMFDRRCGQLSYAVSGPILDNDQRVVLTGEAPLVGAKCRVQGAFTEVLEFRLLNARTATTAAPASAPSPPLPIEEQAVLLPPPASSREPQFASPKPPVAPASNPPAPSSEHAVMPKEAVQPPPLPSAPALKVTAASPSPPPTPAPNLIAEIEKTRVAREQAAAATDAARAAELAAHRALAEAEAARAAAEARIQRSRDEFDAAREENSERRSRLNLILAAMSWTLLLSGAAIVLLFTKLRRSQPLPQIEARKADETPAATIARSPLHSRLSEIANGADALNAAKSHGYQSGGRVRVFFQTRAAHH